MKIKFYKSDGASFEEKDFSEFPEIEGDKGVQALRQVIIAYQANKRQGTVSTKTRSTVRGTGKKPFRQKGTGQGRQGSKRGPQWRGGAIAFGPQPRDYRQKINTKVKALALTRALYESGCSGRVNVIEAFTCSEIKTKVARGLVDKISNGGRTLMIDDSFEDNFVLSSRNLSDVNVAVTSSINALDIVQNKNLIISEKGLSTLLSRINGGEK
tara:strand:+ start:1391 stop:2026 length:636 start_codon:yes stop_codon:yes gene_type:complete